MTIRARLLRFLFIIAAGISLQMSSVETMAFNPTCGDTICDTGENTNNCCYDCCVSWCGNAECEMPYEDEHSCPQDCIPEDPGGMCSSNWDCWLMYGYSWICVSGNCVPAP